MTENSEIRSKFLALSSHSELADLLALTPNELRIFCYSKHYTVFSLKKKTGGYRVINSPEGALKTIQRRLASILLEVYKGRAPVHGFSAHKSIKSNAAQHVNRRYVFNIDLKDFFPSIHYGRVRGLFQGKHYNLPLSVARSLTQLSCHFGSLPQGAPTSPVLSNMICGSLDSKLKSLARQHGCRYTRYADDITFSCDLDSFPAKLATRGKAGWKVGEALEAAIAAEKFAINYHKVSMQVAGGRQVVTGLVVNTKINIPRHYQNSVRGMIYALEKKGIDQAESDFHAKYETKQSLKSGKHFKEVLAGRVNYIGFIKGWDSDLYIKFARRLMKQGVRLRKEAALITSGASNFALYQALWIIDAGASEHANQQSSGFSLGKYGIVTAAHAVGDYDSSGKWKQHEYIQVRQPHLGDGKVFKVTVLVADEHSDLAIINYPFAQLVSFQLGQGTIVAQRDVVRVLGFPHYHSGDSCTDQDFVVNASRVYSGIHHRVMAGAVIKGNSGGPVLNMDKQIVGIVLKGQQISARFSDIDSLSSFAIAETLKVLLSKVS